MNNIFITGATGNVGREVIKNLQNKKGEFQIIVGLRDLKPDGPFSKLADIKTTYFDFTDPENIENALDNCDTFFLIRPPQLSDVKKYFDPLIKTAVDKQVRHIVFLSVQGVDASTLIPHHKIERSIEESGIPFTFLRPAYFMQNFTTTLRNDIIEDDRIYLPAGDAKFTLIDVEDIGRVAAEILTSPDEHSGRAYHLTNNELLTFGEMSKIMSDVLDREIRYKSPDPLSFFVKKKLEGLPSIYILVMIMLHYLPRFQGHPSRSDWVEKLTSSKPRSFAEFVKKNKHLLQKD